MESIDITLKTDSQGKEISLNNMSLETSKSLREILDALINIVEYEQNLDLHIGIDKGSAVQRIIGNEENLSVVYNKILDASDSKYERDNVYVNQLNVIHRNIQSIGDFTIYYNKKDSKTDIKSLFSKKFKNTRAKNNVENNFNVEFITGILELNGGKKPNFHLNSKELPITIQCDFDEAIKVNSFLYKEIKISAWARSTPRGMEYKFCDLYASESEKYYHEFNSFFKELEKKDGTEPFHFISEKLEKFYDEKDYAGARKFIRIFLNKYSLPTYLRTILVMSKGFKNDDFFSETLKRVENLLSNKIGKIY